MASGLLSTAQNATLPQQTAVPQATAPDLTASAPQATSATPVAATTPANVASVAAPTPVVARTITEPETVSGQLNKLLKEDSTYLQSARNRGMEQSNQRGLINSTLAAGNAERAAIDAATPIATQDATINANAGQSAQNANQDLGLTGYKATLDSAQQAENFDYRTKENDQNIAANTKLQDDRLKSTADLQTQAEAAQLTRQRDQNDAALVQQTQQQQATSTLQTTLKQMDINLDLTKLSATERDSLTTATAPIIQQVMSEISQIERTADETMSASAKADAIAQQNALLRTNLQTISSLYGYKLEWDDLPIVTTGTNDISTSDPNAGGTGAALPGEPAVTTPPDQGNTNYDT